MHSFASFKTAVGETHWRHLSEKKFIQKKKPIGETYGLLRWGTLSGANQSGRAKELVPVKTKKLSVLERNTNYSAY